MNGQDLRARRGAGEKLLGFAVSYATSAIIEDVGGEFDWLWICGQHGRWDRASAAHAVQAADLVDTPAVIRVPGHEYGIIGPYIDLDPAGVMVPMGDTPEQAKQVVQAVRFPPLGNRSFGGLRMISRHGRDYPAKPEAAPLLIVQIETPVGVENADAIAATPGVDSLLFGAVDFSLRTGLAMGDDRQLAAYDDAAERILSACKAHGKFGGIVAGDDDVLEKAARMGYQMISLGNDAGHLKRAADARLASARRAIESLA